MKYQTPFYVRDSVIYDQTGKKVKLWGVNYYTPFNSNFYNIEELGKDHFKAIDEDIAHFKLMNIDFIRIHYYDREITDKEGHLVENKNMRVLDYLLDQCEKNDIYLMITPTVWWNTVNNQIYQDQYYAYWFIDSQEAFGFSNYYSCDSMIWDPDAIRCQQTYLNELFHRKSTANGKYLKEHKNIVAFELFNEPRFPRYEQLFADADLSRMENATLSRGRQRLKLLDMWKRHLQDHPNANDSPEEFSRFRSELIRNYFETFWPMVDEYFGNQIIKGQFPSYNGLIPEDLKPMFEACSIDALTIGTYLNVNGFDAANTDSANHLSLAKKWFAPYENLPKGKFARIAYEFDATATLNGYPFAAIAAMYAKYDIQMAAFFTYTPYAVAAWNPGWLVHYMNLAHTPSRAAAFVAAGEIFRNHEPSDEVCMEEDSWHGRNYLLTRKNDLVFYRDETTICYSNDNECPIGDLSGIQHVSGRGKSLFAESDSNGCYFLEKIGKGLWRLNLFPAQKYLSDPGRGKAFRFMANRYVNCLKEPPVSLLMERKIIFRIVFSNIVLCRDLSGNTVPVSNGWISVSPGVYELYMAE